MYHPHDEGRRQEARPSFSIQSIGAIIAVGILCFGIGLFVMARVGVQAASLKAPVIISGQVMIAPTVTRGPVPTPRGDVRKARVGALITVIKTVSRLETQEYTVVADSVQSRQSGFLGVDGESIQAHAVGTVIGRVDLAGLTLGDDLRSGDIIVSEDGESVDITLPFGEVSRPILDLEQTSFNNHTVTWWSKADPALWNAALKDATDLLVQKACETGIASQASSEAERQLRAIVGLGFQHTTIRTRPATAACGLRQQ